MKVYISADIEGIGGVVRSESSSPAGREYAVARKLMTGEINAAAGGAFEAGAQEVVVADSHNIGLNLLPEELDERVKLIMGMPRPLSMMTGIERGFSAVFLVGYHAMAETADSPLAHTFMGRVAEVRMNGRRLGEIGLSAALAGGHGAPVVLVTGDDKACSEAAGLLAGVRTVAVKEGLGSYAGLCLHPAECRRRIREQARQALAGASGVEPFVLEGRVTLEIRFTTASGADQVKRLPGAERVDGTTIRFQGRDFVEAFNAFHVMTELAGLTPAV